jgi:hypothetical protein
MIDSAEQNQDQGECSKERSTVASGFPKTSELESLVGRELDAAISNRVIGFGCNCDGNTRENPYKMPSFCRIHGTVVNGAVRHYSTDIAAAMEVVAALRKVGWAVSLNITVLDDSWRVELFHWSGNNCQREEAKGTLPEAICRAALQATASVSAQQPSP